MKWIYLSPHYDDAVLSCGGLIWEQTQAGEEVENWTICAGVPPLEAETPYAQMERKLGSDAGDYVAIRRWEDEEACRRVGMAVRYFDYLDCIYRVLPQTGEPVIQSWEQLWQPMRPGEAYLVERLTGQLEQALPPGAQVVAPLTIGGHVDHRLVRAAVERLSRPFWLYADYPYIERLEVSLEDWVSPNWLVYQRALSPAAQQAWFEAIQVYQSQLKGLWESPEQMAEMFERYLQKQGGSRLWQPLR